MHRRDGGPALLFCNRPTVLLAEKQIASPIPWTRSDTCGSRRRAKQRDHSRQIQGVNPLDALEMLPQ